MTGRNYFFAPLLLFLFLSVGCTDSEQPSQSDPQSQIDQKLTPADVVLDIEKQKDIWDAEHVTFCLEQRFGKLFSTALKDRDGTRTNSFFLDNATGEWVRPALTLFVQDTISEEVCTTNRDALGHADLLTAINGLTAERETIDKVGFRVLSITPKQEDSGVWQSDVQVTVGGKDEGKTFYTKTIAAIEYTVDEPLELGQSPFIKSWITTEQITRKSEAPLFKEVTSRFALDRLPLIDNWKIPFEQSAQYRSQIAAADFDNDGFVDIAVGTYSGEPVLLRNQGGRSMMRIDQQVGLRRWSAEDSTSLATWIDIDNDGFQDLMLGNRVYKNSGGRRFQDITQASGITFNTQPMGAAIADYDLDGDLDIYICYQDPEKGTPKPQGPSPWVGDDSSGGANHLWQNQGNGTFKEVAIQANADAGKRKSFAANWLYYNDDHYPDLYIANDFGHNNLLINRGDGTFEDKSADSATADFATSMGVATGHLDGDGKPEIYVANMYSKMGRRIIGQVSESDYPPGIYQQIKGSCAGNRLYRQTDDNSGRCLENSISLGINDIGWAYAPVFADFDGNGWADVYATTGFMSRDRSKPDG